MDGLEGDSNHRVTESTEKGKGKVEKRPSRYDAFPEIIARGNRFVENHSANESSSYSPQPIRYALGIRRNFTQKLSSAEIMEKVFQTIPAFVEGAMSPSEFRDHLYSQEAFAAVLNDDPTRPRSGYLKTSVYDYLLSLDFDDPGDHLNAVGALSEFLARKGVSFVECTGYGDHLDLIHDAQPSWLDVNLKWLQDVVLSQAGARNGSDLRKWLSAEFEKRFRYVESPPTWIQSPAWPINSNGPLTFLGQLEIRGYFHDDAAAYIFLDPKTGVCETIIQVA